MNQTDLRKMPKVEFHRHLDGSIRFDTIKELAGYHHIDLIDEYELAARFFDLTLEDPGPGGEKTYGKGFLLTLYLADNCLCCLFSLSQDNENILSGLFNIKGSAFIIHH